MEFQQAIQNPKGWCYQRVAVNMSANLEDPAVVMGLENVNLNPSSQEGIKKCSVT